MLQTGGATGGQWPGQVVIEDHHDFGQNPAIETKKEERMSLDSYTHMSVTSKLLKIHATGRKYVFLIGVNGYFFKEHKKKLDMLEHVTNKKISNRSN